jgi:hypothetical protein
VELLRDGGWQVWRWPEDTLFPAIEADLVDVAVSYIRFGDDGVRFRTALDGPAAVVKPRWRTIEALARNYRFAEQEGFNGVFQNWPDSKYGTPTSPPFNNSNTFVFDTMRRAGLGVPPMNGVHPGNRAPNPVPDLYRGRIPFR